MGWAVGGYALSGFLVEDRVKLASYWWLGRHLRHVPAMAVRPS